MSPRLPAFPKPGQPDHRSPIAPLALLTAATLTGASPAWAGSRFYLPDELPSRPQHFAQAKAASLRITTPHGSGTGVLTSNNGYILTARHILAGGNPNVIGPYQAMIPELSGLGRVDVVHASDTLDYAVLKFTPDPQGPLANQPLACVPVAERSLLSGSPIWMLGFPRPITPTDGTLASDGFRELTVPGSVFYPGPHDAVQLPPSGAFGLSLENSHHVFYSDGQAAPGMSGGPIVDSDGDLAGITSAVISTMDIDPIHVIADPYRDHLMAAFRIGSIMDDLKSRAGDNGINTIFNCERISVPQPGSGRRYLSFEQLLQEHGHEIIEADRSIGGAHIEIARFFKKLAADPALARLVYEFLRLQNSMAALPALEAAHFRNTTFFSVPPHQVMSREDIYPHPGLVVNHYRQQILLGLASIIVEMIQERNQRLHWSLTKQEGAAIARHLSNLVHGKAARPAAPAVTTPLLK